VYSVLLRNIEIQRSVEPIIARYITFYSSIHRMITNDVSDCINALTRIAHIICNHPKFVLKVFEICDTTCRISVSIVTKLRTGRVGICFRQGQGLSVRHRVKTSSGTHSASCRIGIVGGTVSPVLKRSGRETDESPPPSTEVSNVWSNTSIPPHFTVWFLVKYRISLQTVVFS